MRKAGKFRNMWIKYILNNQYVQKYIEIKGEIKNTLKLTKAEIQHIKIHGMLQNEI